MAGDSDCHPEHEDREVGRDIALPLEVQDVRRERREQGEHPGYISSAL